MMLVAFVAKNGDLEGLKRGDSGSMDGRERGSMHGCVCEGHGYGDLGLFGSEGQRPEEEK